MLPEFDSLPDEKKGLTSVEAENRFKKYGPNLLPEKPPPSDFVILLSQLKNPLVYVLLAAGVVTTILGDYSDSIIIFFAVLINTILGFVQERKASRALEALKELIHPTAKVIRDGQEVTVEAEKIVPGDLVILNQGDKVAADGTLLFANRLHLSEALLTGESSPVEKKEDEEVYMGTIVLAGRAFFLVEKTGADTKIGGIAEKLQEPSQETPLKIELTVLSKHLSLLVLGLTFFVFFIGLISGRGIVEIFTTSVALAVSSIPEGLLVALTVVLAIGMQRILKRRGLVRRLVSAETLGGVTTICLDKTGTLTEGEMKVAEIVGQEKEIAKQVVLANDFDDPLVIAAYEWATKSHYGSKAKVKSFSKNHRRFDSIPFSSQERYFASLNKWDETNNMIFVNGAPEFLLNWSVVKNKEKEEIEKEIERLTLEGKRLVGLARKKVSSSKKKLTKSDSKNNLHFIGILAFNDPVRKGVKKALRETEKAGIKLITITGDYAETAVHVMKELGIYEEGDQTILGKNLLSLNEQGLRKRLKSGKVKLFARTTPDQKFKIIEALKKNGEVVAMMGDGVNDAPAIKRADIGIVVGEASDVAKETADLVLLDSRFETVVAAIEEGRGVYDNIRKIILYLMSDAFEEIVAVIGTLILGLPLPVSAAQILWINLVSDGFPDLALTIDPKEEKIMERTPRAIDERLVSGWMRMLIGITSLVGGVIAFSLFIYFYTKTNDLVLSRSITFAALGVNSLVFVFSIRTLTHPFWVANPLKNKWLNLAVGAGLFFQFLPFSTPSLREFFGLKVLGVTPIIIIFIAAFFVFIIIEAVKAIIRHNFKWFQH